MGRGNVCVFGEAEGLYYVDFDDLYIYRKLIDEGSDEYEYRTRREIEDDEIDQWEYDETSSWLEQLDFEEELVRLFTKRFPSFSKCKENEWISREQRAIMENELFYVCFEDNQWSMAVELITKDDSPYEQYSKGGLQMKHYKWYLEGLRDCLFARFDEIGTYSGAWTSGRIRREDFEKEESKCSA